MNRDEIIAHMTILIDRAYEAGYSMGYTEAIETHWKDSLDA